MKTIEIKEFRNKIKKIPQCRFEWTVNYIIEETKKDYFIPTKKALCIHLLEEFCSDLECNLYYDYSEQFDNLAVSLFSKYINDDLIDRNRRDTTSGNTNLIYEKRKKLKNN